MPTASTLEHWESVLEEAAQPLNKALQKPPKAGVPSPQRKKYGLSPPPSPKCKGATISGAPAAVKAHEGQKMLSRAQVDQITAAWQEAAQAAEEERSAFESELKALKLEHAETKVTLQKTQQRLNAAEVSMEAYSEAAASASAAAHTELSAVLEQAKARAEAQTKLLSSKADMATRDVATLRAQKLLHDVSSTTLSLEMGLLDGTVGLLVERLHAAHEQLDTSLAAQAQLQGQADASLTKASVSVLEAQHLRHVVAAQRRTIDELRGHVSGAQVWARETENAFDETLVAIRYAAAEQLTVQSKRLKEWEEELEAKEMGRGRRASVGSLTSKPGDVAGGKLGELIAAESVLLTRQAQLFADVRERTESRELRMLHTRMEAVDAELATIHRVERDFATELRAVGAAKYDALLQSTHTELAAARARLREQERTMGRMEERMGAEIAMHRCKFDEAVQGLMDEASRLSTDDAAALTAAAKDQAHLFNAQGSEGAKDVAAGARRRSYVMARDAQVLRHLGAAGTPGGGDAAGGSHASAHADAPAGTPASSSDVRMVDESALIAARRQLAAVEDELRHRLEESSAAMTRVTDESRRDLQATRRWAAQLEAQLEQSNASLAEEREESARLDAELASLRPQLEGTEERLRGLESSMGEKQRSPGGSSSKAPAFGGGGGNSGQAGLGSHVHAGFGTFSLDGAGVSPTGGAGGTSGGGAGPSRRIVKARAMISMALPADDDDTEAPAGTHGARALVVGTPAKPEDMALRPSAVRPSPGTSAIKRRKSTGKSKSWTKGTQPKAAVV